MLRRTRSETTVHGAWRPCCWRSERPSRYAAASVLQQREAHADDVADGEGAVGGGVRLVLRLARKPVWLAGLAADAGGYGLQALALGVGELLVVQPVITSGLLFALPASAWWSGRKLGRADFGWACALAIGLTVFLLLAGSEGGRDRAVDRGMVGVRGDHDADPRGVHGRRARSVGTRRAVLFAFTTGAIFGLTAALTKSSVVLLDDHGFGALAYWEPYALAVLGALGFVVNQRAFQAGSLTASLPTLTVVEPVVAAVIGVTMLHETIPTAGVVEWLAVANISDRDDRRHCDPVAFGRSSRCDPRTRACRRLDASRTTTAAALNDAG